LEMFNLKSALVYVVLVFAAFSAVVRAADSNVVQNKCGDDVSYTFYKDTGLLIVNGTGEMYNYTSSKYPFDLWRIYKVVIEEGVTSIGNYFFNMCLFVTSISIPSTVTRIGDGAIRFCQQLKSVDIPAEVVSIGADAFYGCTVLTSINIDKNNKDYTTVDGVLFDHEMKTLIWSPSSVAGSYSIPYGVTTISAYAFYVCSSLIHVTIPSSVTSIGERAFTSLPYQEDISFTFLGHHDLAPNCELLHDWVDNVCVPIDYDSSDFCGLEIPTDKEMAAYDFLRTQQDGCNDIIVCTNGTGYIQKRDNATATLCVSVDPASHHQEMVKLIIASVMICISVLFML